MTRSGCSRRCAISSAPRRSNASRVSAMSSIEMRRLARLSAVALSGRTANTDPQHTETAMTRNELRFVLLNSLFGVAYAAFNLLLFAVFMRLNAIAWTVALGLG